VNSDGYALLQASPLGLIGVRLTEQGAIQEIELFGKGSRRRPVTRPGAAAVAEALATFFRDPAAPCNVALAPQGTEFQRRVWTALRRIPAGQVLTYGELARRLGSAPRAVGQACRANPIPLLIPCHRVVAASGLGGYAGATGGELLARKRWLLEQEGWQP
jgi:methylated-DNA-[protein]-cysteine S-methyltransferase